MSVSFSLLSTLSHTTIVGGTQSGEFCGGAQSDGVVTVLLYSQTVGCHSMELVTVSVCGGVQPGEIIIVETQWVAVNKNKI